MTKTTNSKPRTKLTYFKAQPEDGIRDPYFEVTISGKDEDELTDDDWRALSDLASFVNTENGGECYAVADCGACYIKPGTWHDGDDHFVTEWKREVRGTYAAWKEGVREDQAVAADAVATAHAEAPAERTLTAESAAYLETLERRIADAESELEAAEEEYADAETENCDAHSFPDCFDVDLSDQRLEEAERRLADAKEDLEAVRWERDDYLANWATYEGEGERIAVTPDANPGMQVPPVTTATISNERARDLAALHEDFGWSYHELAGFYGVTMAEAETVCILVRLGIEIPEPADAANSVLAYARREAAEASAELSRLDEQYGSDKIGFDEWNHKADQAAGRMIAMSDVCHWIVEAERAKGRR